MGKLKALAVKGKLSTGMHNDGDGLYLRVAKTGSRSWILRTRVHGKKRDIGLGGLATRTLAEARSEATEMRKLARLGGDPLALRRRAIPTFEEAALQVWNEQIVPTAKNEKHKAQWINTLRQYAFPKLGGKTVDGIKSNDVMATLLPIWLEKPETARRVRQRLRTVFDWCIVKEYREAANPLSGIEKALPKQRDKVKHHKSLPNVELPALMDRLEEAEGVGALALRFTILTAARSGEVRGARWQEIDGNSWTVPAGRMKGGVEHRVPLSGEALEILEDFKGYDDVLIFPGSQRGKPLSDMSLSAVLKRLNVPVTVHGFRSTFRDWVGECTTTPREIAEMSLAHSVGTAVEKAYARSDLFEKRKLLMERWGAYCSSRSAEVVQLSSTR